MKQFETSFTARGTATWRSLHPGEYSPKCSGGTTLISFHLRNLSSRRSNGITPNSFHTGTSLGCSGTAVQWSLGSETGSQKRNSESTILTTTSFTLTRGNSSTGLARVYPTENLDAKDRQAVTLAPSYPQPDKGAY